MAERFRARTLLTGWSFILLCVVVMIILFPYITGLKPHQSGAPLSRMLMIFYASPFIIVLLGFWITRFLRSREFVRRIVINDRFINLNGKNLKQATLIRGPVLIRYINESRAIEAIRVESGRRAFIIAAKDDPEALDRIESLIPQAVRHTDSEFELKGVL